MTTFEIDDIVWHPAKGLGRVTSIASCDWVFVKFLGYVAPRMCRADRLEAAP